MALSSPRSSAVIVGGTRTALAASARDAYTPTVEVNIVIKRKGKKEDGYQLVKERLRE